MVLEDTNIQDMSLDAFLRVSRPKVDGSVHLSDLFQTDTLDFFVFLSSAITVVGRPGQANYSAANMFMVSLAEQRRRRGLAASVMHIGPLRGVGFLLQMDVNSFSRARRQGAAFVFMSEREFHQMFAEAVVAGRGRAGYHHHQYAAGHWPIQAGAPLELLGGVRRVSRSETSQPVWAYQPLMIHFIRGSESAEVSQAATSSLSIPVKAQLAQARSRGQVLDITQRALELKLCGMFQMDPSKLDDEDSRKALAASRLDQLGIDSLLAIDLRGWLLNTLQVNTPVLKILSGISVAELASIAADSIPVGLLPRLQGEIGSDPTTTKDNFTDNLANVAVPSVDSTTVVEREAVSLDECSREEDSAIGLCDQRDKYCETFTSSIADSTELKKVSEPPCASSGNLTAIQGATSESPVKIVRSFQLSFSQRALWFVTKFLKDKASLNHTGWVRWSGRMRVDDLRRALRVVGQRHEALRTCFVEGEDGRPMQGIMRSSRLSLETREISNEDEVALEAQRLRDKYVFDLARGETIRVLVLTRAAADHYIVVGFHPIVLDARSLQVLFDDLILHYIGPSSGHDLTRVVPQFSEFSEAQHDDHAAGVFQDMLKYWRDELTPPPPALPVLGLSKMTVRPALTSYDNVRVSSTIGTEIGESVKAVCRAHGVTQFHFYLAVFRTLLQRYAPVNQEDSDDLVVGISDANRIEHEMTECVGPFANLLPVRLHTSSSVPFLQLLRNVRTKVYSALENGRVPFQVMLDEYVSAYWSTSFDLFHFCAQEIIGITDLRN